MPAKFSSLAGGWQNDGVGPIFATAAEATAAAGGTNVSVNQSLDGLELGGGGINVTGAADGGNGLVKSADGTTWMTRAELASGMTGDQKRQQAVDEYNAKRAAMTPAQRLAADQLRDGGAYSHSTDAEKAYWDQVHQDDTTSDGILDSKGGRLVQSVLTAGGSDIVRSASDKAGLGAVGNFFTDPGAAFDEINKEFGGQGKSSTPGSGAPAAAVDPLGGIGSGAATPGGNIDQLKADALAGGAGGDGSGGTDASGTLDSMGRPIASTVNREKVDSILDGLNSYGGQIAALAGDNTGLSAAEAALTKASREADIRSGIATEASQRNALGTARSLRSRGDRALGERQAIGESSFIGQEAARTDALRQAEQEGQLGILRATEADSDRKFKLTALSEAAKLGLDTASLEVDIEKVNIASATNYLNQVFETERTGMKIDAQRATDILNFTKDMASIQFQYDKLSVDDQNFTDQLLMDRYKIDKETMVKLKELKAKSQVNWGQMLQTVVSGAATGVTKMAVPMLMSDVRTKQDFGTPGDADIAELFTALDAQTYKYKQPEKHGQGLQFGFMAQALEGTKLGKAMVSPDPSGLKRVDTGRVAMATAAGLSTVFERLAALESAVN